MVKCQELYSLLKENDLTFFSGVPDSTFKDWMKFLVDAEDLTNVVAVNECEAVAICAGYHLATGKIGIVYMQNSGEGKTVNPLTSLTDPEVYSMPVLLLIGWRGEPGKKDEPQHKKMGRIMISLLDTLEIPHEVLPNDLNGVRKAIGKAKRYMIEKNAPYALIIRKGLLEPYGSKTKYKRDYEMTREDAIKKIIDNLDGSEAIVSTTGKTSRELFEYREALNQVHQNDFYTVGSMGCASSIGLGIAMTKPDREIFILDGDGAFLMQMGSVATIGHFSPKNFKHIIFDNESHDSTGGQPTVSETVDFESVALACGYKNAETVDNRDSLIYGIKRLKSSEGPSLLVIKVRTGARKDLGRPTTTPIENKNGFMGFLAR